MTQSSVRQVGLGEGTQLVLAVPERILPSLRLRGAGQLHEEDSCSMLQLETLRREREQPGETLEFYLCFGYRGEPTFVPALKMAPRAPLGPSLVLNFGMPFDGIAVDLQKSLALRRET